MSHKYAPPFATLALVQNVGGAYTRDATFSLAITPSLPGMKSLSVGEGGGGGGGGVGTKRGTSPSPRRRDAHDTSGRLTSLRVEERGSRTLPRSSWRVHRWCRRSVFAVDTSTVDSRVALNISSVGWVRVFFWGGGLMRGIKIPQQDFALKTQGGLMREGGRICGTLRYLNSQCS